jgi:hypothetical protein
MFKKVSVRGSNRTDITFRVFRFLSQFGALDVPVFLRVVLDCAVRTELAHLVIKG